jgi:hypothetical protein
VVVAMDGVVIDDCLAAYRAAWTRVRPWQGWREGGGVRVCLPTSSTKKTDAGAGAGAESDVQQTDANANAQADADADGSGKGSGNGDVDDGRTEIFE